MKTPAVRVCGLFEADPHVPPDHNGRHVCARCHLPGRPTALDLLPYRCTEPRGHPGDHRAVIDGTAVAQWPRTICDGAP